jgi:serine/threonine-protein kinase RsbW
LSAKPQAAGVKEVRSVPLTVADTMNSPRDAKPTVAVNATIASDAAEARRIQDEIERHLQTRHVSEHDIFSIKLALEEALVNAMKHGNQMDRAKKVLVSYQIFVDRFDVQISDDGSGFDPSDVPDPTAFENLERPCGRGLMLMRHYMTEVVFTQRGNGVFMSKVFRSNENGKK